MRAALTEAGLPVSVLRHETGALGRARREVAPAVLADLGAAPARMLRLIAALAAERRGARIVALWPEGGSGLAATALRVGAFDHLPRGAAPEHLREAALNALAAGAAPETEAEAGWPEDAVEGGSEAAAALRRVLIRLGPALCPVLLRGETGVGKRRAARALAALGPRGAPLREIDCAALGPAAQEAALFGEDGAATTPGGTLLLHEVCALGPPLQSRVLRLLRGAAGPFPPPRVICTTRRDPEVEMREGRLRDELRRHLGAAELTLPPLRAREGDGAEIAERAARLGPLPAATVRAIGAHDWPGNLPELLETAAALRRAGRVDAAALPASVLAGAAAAAKDGAAARAAGPAEPPALPDRDASLVDRVAPLVGATLAEVEAALIETTLARCGGSVSRAAAMLGVRPSTLYRRGVTGPRGKLAKGAASGDAPDVPRAPREGAPAAAPAAAAPPAADPPDGRDAAGGGGWTSRAARPAGNGDD